ncbi:MAG: putative sulfate exporter family transporter [Gammaproteobacteria bacterium]|nr:putative sulfate exporter family transporter [Gammaproteobacteria bacterium]MBV9727676.1 putative sulfate exporter family transporter [Gammaproteobacteria bacterium]
MALRRGWAPGWVALRRAAPGLALAIALASLARVLAQAFAAGVGGLPKFPLSPVMCAVLLGMLWRNSVGVPGWATSGLAWTMHRLLRVGIALVGLRLTLAGATAIALTALPVAISCLTVALLAGLAIARALAVPRRLGLLLAIGTAVCGCTAVVAMSPVIRARHAETAFAVTCVVLFGCIAMLCYPWVAGHFLAASPTHAGIFLGTAIHDTSQVIGAALIYSQQASAPAALAAASVAKLLRNLSIAVLLPAAAWWARREAERAGEPRSLEPMHTGAARDAATETTTRTPLVPLFVLAFIGFILVRTAGDAIAGASAVWPALINTGYTASDLFLTCGMTAVGLSVSFTDMWRIGWRPLLSGFVVATLVGSCSLLLTYAMAHFLT